MYLNFVACLYNLPLLYENLHINWKTTPLSSNSRYEMNIVSNQLEIQCPLLSYRGKEENKLFNPASI
jgi:hypothetical protein